MSKENRYAARTPRLPLDVSDPGLTLAIDFRLRMYEKLHEMRQFSVAVNKLFLAGLIRGSSHLSTGMEAIAAGFGAALRIDDLTLATYRGHAHTIAKGVPLDEIMAELIGRKHGVLDGKGGSMHLTSVERGLLGSFAIVGAHLTIACGSAWSAQMRGSDQVTVCFFGDGATNIGAFHEALNLAAVWKLPVIFVCENNLYMEYSPIDMHTAVKYPAADRAAAYGLEKFVIDGNDVDIVFDFAEKAIERVRSGQGPVLVEALTYRHGGHSRADPGDYRPPSEISAWMLHDPIAIYHQRLLALGTSERDLVDIEQSVVQRVLAASEVAVNSEFPDSETAFTDLWSDGTSGWKKDVTK